jgi:D-glycero-alpha-D-manno-heptose-7-phosphate kinase
VPALREGRAERWRVPVRIDLAGGTLDLWPIYAMLGGCLTVNAAVDLWIELEVERGAPGHRLRSHDLDVDLAFDAWPADAPAQLSWVWRVLDAAPRPPAKVEIRSPVPQGSGLGASSCMAVGLLGAALDLEAGDALAAQVPLLRDLEARELSTPTGWQDYYPAALGGCLALHWDRPLPRWERLEPHADLMSRLLVFYTGKPHHSGLTNWEAYRRFIEGDTATRAALEEIRGLAQQMARAVPSDSAAVAELLEREGRARARLSPAVETDAMRAVRERGLREGWYAGMKACGAGGGGCCILVTREGRREDAEAALRAMGLPPLPVSLTPKGLHRL